MICRCLLGFVCLLALLVAGERVAAQPPAKIRELQALLNEIIDMKDFRAPMTLKEALGLLQDKLNAKFQGDDVLPILVDEAAFKAVDPDAPDVYDTEVRLPPFPRRMSVATALRFALAKIPTKNATYLLRQGMIEVTTLQAASPKQLLRQRVTANFKQFPLHDAIEVLAEQTGLNVVLDQRVGDKLKTPVSATFGNGITLEGALRLLTDMTDLKLYITDGYVYVTTPANAKQLHKERRDAEDEAHRDRLRKAPPPEPGGKDAAFETLVCGGDTKPAPAPATTKQAPRREPEPKAGPSRKGWLSILNEAAEAKSSQEPMTLKQALDLVGGWIANYIPNPQLFVDEEAFLAEDPNLRTLLDTEIRLPPLPRKMAISSLLRVVLDKFPGRNATFLLRSGTLEITTVKAASPKQLLRQKVLANFQNLPLEEALDELAEQTGLSVMVDARVGDKRRAAVTAVLTNDVTLEAALRLLTDMAD
ncbi:MAG TPA: hypothetical protein VEL76_24080, partial [Gemmataceae bacterium]|nr:hypothetical protein [Gemmataceae bacterium]